MVPVEPANILALPRATWEAELLEDTSLRRMILEYYDREQVALRRYLAFLRVDRETSQEIVQESFLKLHEHLAAGGDRSNLRAWLYRVAHNLARNAQTSWHVRKTDSLADAAGAGDPAASELSVEEALLAGERLTRVRQAMDQLTPAQKQCLVLRAQGLKYREIADVLNLSVSTVGENVQRGLEKLKVLI